MINDPDGLPPRLEAETPPTTMYGRPWTLGPVSAPRTVDKAFAGTVQIPIDPPIGLEPGDAMYVPTSLDEGSRIGVYGPDRQLRQTYISDAQKFYPEADR